MAEPYQDLDLATRARAVEAFTRWARRQHSPSRPFLQLLDGSTISPQDLLETAPPGPGEEPPPPPPPTRAASSFVPFRRRGSPRAWPHVLNLVAVAAKHGDTPIDELLDDLEGRAEPGAPAGPATA